MQDDTFSPVAEPRAEDAAAAGGARLPRGQVAVAVLGRSRRRLEGVVRLLEDGLEDPARTVHGCRRHLKRVRAGLRLLRDAGQPGLRDPERVCRDVGRRLSVLRDADVSLACLARMARGTRDAGVADEIERVAHRIRSARAGHPLGRRLAAELAGRLAGVDERLAEAAVTGIGDAEVTAALDASHGAGRRAWRRAQAEDRPENWHALRKAAKRELYQLVMIEQSLDPGRAERIPALEALADTLGEQQDLWVVAGHAVRTGLAEDGPLGRLLAEGLDRARRRSRREAAAAYG